MDLIKGVIPIIAQKISKSDERREARGRFETASTIAPWIVRHEVQLLINRIYITIFGNKMSYENFFWAKTSVALYLSFENWRHREPSHPLVGWSFIHIQNSVRVLCDWTKHCEGSTWYYLRIIVGMNWEKMGTGLRFFQSIRFSQNLHLILFRCCFSVRKVIRHINRVKRQSNRAGLKSSFVLCTVYGDVYMEGGCPG